MNEQVKKLFEIWMGRNHPNYYSVVVIVNIVLVTSFVVSVVLPFFHVQWWWKLALLTTVLLTISFIVDTIMVEKYFQAFKLDQSKIKFRR